MTLPPISALAAAVRAQIAAAMDRDLSMMMESHVEAGAGAGPAESDGATATRTPAAPAAAPGPTAGTQPARTPQPTAPPSVTQAADTARAAAAGRQASMAPLFADLEQALASPSLPPPVKAVVRQILAFQVPLDKPPTGPVIARAVSRSGLFLEAHLATAGESPPAPDLKAALLTLRQALAAPERPTAPQPPRAAASPAPAPAATPPGARDAAPAPASAAPARAAVAAQAPPAPTAPGLIRAIDQALVRQAAAAPLTADLARALQNPSLPAPVRAAIAQVLAQQAAPPASQAAAAPSSAPGRPATPTAPSPGLPLAPPPVPADGERPPAPELKAALLTLRQALAAPHEEATPPATPRAPPAAPPSREGATGAQQPVASSLPERADAAAITRALAHGVDQAVARQTLHQLASRPDGAGQAWMFELPLATPQGTAVAQFEIERDGQAAGQDESEGWRVRFSIDMEPLGPLHVHLHAGGGRAAVNVWAERPESLPPLRSLGGELSRALQAEVRFQAGAPSQPAPLPGRFLDAST